MIIIYIRIRIIMQSYQRVIFQQYLSNLIANHLILKEYIICATNLWKIGTGDIQKGLIHFFHVKVMLSRLI